MLKFLKRLFSREKVQKMKKFDVIIQKTNANGNTVREERSGLCAPNREFLINIHRNCGEEVVQILREYQDGDTQKIDAQAKSVFTHKAKPVQTQPQLENGTQTQNKVCVNGEYVDVGGPEIVLKQDVPELRTVIPEPDVSNIAQETQRLPVQQPVYHERRIPVVEKKPPRYFKVGNVECKDDNGKLYQKQWMNVGNSDDYRIVSDTNNKIVPLKDKHIEKLCWVLIQDEAEDTSGESMEKKELVCG